MPDSGGPDRLTDARRRGRSHGALSVDRDRSRPARSVWEAGAPSVRCLGSATVGRPARRSFGSSDARSALDLDHAVERLHTPPARASALRQPTSRPARARQVNGNEFGRQAFAARLPEGVAHPDPLRTPPDHGHVERLHRTILEECWRSAFARYLQVHFTGLRRELAHYLHDYNHEREHHGRITNGRRPADFVYGARKMEPR